MEFKPERVRENQSVKNWVFSPSVPLFRHECGLGNELALPWCNRRTSQREKRCGILDRWPVANVAFWPGGDRKGGSVGNFQMQLN